MFLISTNLKYKFFIGTCRLFRSVALLSMGTEPRYSILVFFVSAVSFLVSITVWLVWSVVQEQEDFTDIESSGRGSVLTGDLLKCSSFWPFLAGRGGPAWLLLPPMRLTMLVKP